jgi:hypothetical protein
MRFFAFESYGVRIRIESNRKSLLMRVKNMANRVLLGRMTEIDPVHVKRTFTVLDRKGQLFLFQDGRLEAESPTPRLFFNYFETLLRVAVAEFAKGVIFIHAGAVGWKGKAIVFPANSFKGKTTLVAALVKKGAVYLSDEYAILDENGMVHPFPKPLSIRDPKRQFRQVDVEVSTLGGISGTEPLPVGVVIFTRFRKNGRWRPEILSQGNGVMQMMQHTIPLRSNAEFSLAVLKSVASRAIMMSSSRCDVKISADEIIDFVDKKIF